MPRTLGDSFIHVNNIDMLVPVRRADHRASTSRSPTRRCRRIGQNIARLVEDGSTIECGIGRIPQALAEFLHDKKDLGVHTEMFSDWIIDLIECGAITCAKKTINRGKVVASFCMGTKRLYDYIDNNPFFEFHPTEYVNDPFVISQHDKMVGHQRRPGGRPDRPGVRRLAGLPVLQRHRRPGGLHPRRAPAAAAARRSSPCPPPPATARSRASCRT